MAKAKAVILEVGKRRRRVQFAAKVTVDGHCIGTIEHPSQITPAMRARGVTARDVSLVLTGLSRAVRFLCNGQVLIERRDPLNIHMAA